MQGGFSYEASVYNCATQADRQPGSSFKPFVYAAALDSGYSPATIVIDAPIEIDTPQGLWTPRNSSDKFYGPTPLRTGIEQSRNLMTIRLAQEVGMDVIGDYAERFGVYDRMNPFLANSLARKKPHYLGLLQLMRCLPMAENAYNPPWWIGFKIGMEKPFTVMMNANALNVGLKQSLQIARR